MQWQCSKVRYNFVLLTVILKIKYIVNLHNQNENGSSKIINSVTLHFTSKGTSKVDNNKKIESLKSSNK